MLILLYMLVLALPGILRAQERAIDHFAGVGIRAMGMGGAYVGVADDFTATYWNPAGLAQMGQREVYAAFVRNRYESETVLGGTRAAGELNNTRFGALGGVVPYPVYRGSLVFAAGFNRVRDFDFALRSRGYSAVDSLQLDVFNRHEGGLSVASVAGAVDVSPAISLGLALNLWNGEDESISDVDKVDVDSLDYFAITRQVTRDFYADDYGAFSAKLGLMIRSSGEAPMTRFGLTVSSGVTYEIDYRFTGAPPPDYSFNEYDRSYVIVEGLDLPQDVPAEERFNLIPEYESIAQQGVDAGGRPYVLTDAGRRITDTGTSVIEEVREQTFNGSYKLKVPIEFGVGASFRPIPDLLLAGSAHVAEWSQSKYQARDRGDLRADLVFEEEYEDVIRYHLGLEWQVPAITLALRAGYYTDPVPYLGPRTGTEAGGGDEHLVLIKQDRRFFTLGAGLLVDEVLQVDAAWTRGSFEQVFAGEQTEDNIVSRVFAGVAYRF